MIALTVTSFNGGPMAQAPSAQFDEMGGSIGRADNNQLVLPDPDRTISRVHARVAFRNGAYILIDCGSNPVSINNRPLGNGQESPIKAGDQVTIGGYAIKVEAAAALSAKPIDPFADFSGLAAPAPAPAARSFGAPASSSVDPLAGFGGSPASSAGADPFAAFGGGAPKPQGKSAAASGGGGGIPDDWDPFAADAAPSPSKADPFAASRGQDFGMEVGGKGSGPLIPDFPGANSRSGSGGGDSLDNLFGLGAGSSSSHSDPFANTPLQAIHAQPNMAASDDPLRSLNSVTQASATSASDQRSELNSPFDLAPMMVPKARPAPPAPAPAVSTAPFAAPTLPADPSATLSGAVRSWEDGSGEGRTIIRAKSSPPKIPPAVTPAPPPSAAALPADLDFDLDIGGEPDDPLAGLLPLAAPPAVVPPAAQPLSRHTEPAAPPPAARPAPPPMAPAGPAMSPGQADELLAALREGLSLPGLPIDRLTPQLMRLIGQLLYHSVEGTVDLLVARAALKREVRAEVTMIVAKENNPLKFSPTVEVAMEHLLKPPARGFMPPDRAMQDAYDDLRAHQFGFLAGMRAALEGVLKRFDPATLEGKLSKGSVLSNMIPGSRKARMWDVFQEMYGQISAEASDDFHELFGKEFLRAYESHIDQLKDRR